MAAYKESIDSIWGENHWPKAHRPIYVDYCSFLVQAIRIKIIKKGDRERKCDKKF